MLYPLVSSRIVSYTVFMNGSRAERPGFECMNASLGGQESWGAHRLEFFTKYC